MFELLIGLQVVDQETYTAYRAAMTPILTQYGGSFGVDVRVAEVLRAPTETTFNRLFTMRFPSEASSAAFFADSAYLAIRARLFTPSVSTVEQLGRYVPGT